MDDLRKTAYKTMNYQALLDIKNSGQFTEANFYRVSRVAHVFHNLAEYIIADFNGFDEDSFWNAVAGLEQQFGMHHYRKIFDEVVSH
ncbi:hypothetical protein [Alicyclobacillus sp. SO9]|uniref:hypothetical protein n=1 Tax=Alicyclobacillus sp. SO9 TaxID=2665646 RepID=UPI0018E7AD57|nr:hypothetical protein [Alicyclobacillus sp. SO9]QQE80622.1 hypothetical protein GI364_09600 [Alicyclobacillus sp. SO9]